MELTIHLDLLTGRAGVVALNRLTLGFTLTNAQLSDLERLRHRVALALDHHNAAVGTAQPRVGLVDHWLDCLPSAWLSQALKALESNPDLSDADRVAMARAAKRHEAQP